MRNPHRPFFPRFLRILGILAGVAAAPACQTALAESGGPSPEQATLAATSEAAPALMTGAQVYNAVCIACHAAPGLGGAPALGDGEAWAARIAQGAETLNEHALNGYSGETGLMPRKGGRLDLSDEEVIRAVEFMVEQSAG